MQILHATKNRHWITCGNTHVHRNTVHARRAPFLHSHNPRLVGPLCCCWGFTSLFVSPWLLWSPIRTPSPLIGLPDVRRRFTLVMYWSGLEGCACVCIDVSVCVFMSLFFSLFLLFVLVCAVCVYLCVEFFFFFLLCARKPFWPLHTPQAVSTAVELLNSGPACSDYSTTQPKYTHKNKHTHTLMLWILKLYKYF